MGRFYRHVTGIEKEFPTINGAVAFGLLETYMKRFKHIGVDVDEIDESAKEYAL